MGFRSSALLSGPLLLLLAVATLGFVSSACGDDDDNGSPGEVQLGEADNGRAITVRRDSTLVVALPSNITTGFSWNVHDPSPAQVRLEGEPRYVPPGSTSPVVGAAGTQVFTFRAVATGSGELVLEYRRPFEPGVAPAKTWSVKVTVQ